MTRLIVKAVDTKTIFSDGYAFLYKIGIYLQNRL